MEQEILLKLCDIGKNNNNEYCESDFRNRMQDVFNEICFNQSTDKELCCRTESFFSAQSLLKQFYNKHYSNAPAEKAIIDLTALCKGAAFCCDLIAAQWNRRVFFLGTESQVYTLCCERQIVWAVLSLAANAVMYSDSKYIGISLKIRENAVVVSTENCGKLDYEKYFGSFSRDTSSLFCVDKIAARHGGALLSSCFNTNADDHFVKFCLSIEKGGFDESDEKIQNEKKHFKSRNDYISDLLDDRLSPLYTAFCELLF